MSRSWKSKLETSHHFAGYQIKKWFVVHEFPGDLFTGLNLYLIFFLSIS